MFFLSGIILLYIGQYSVFLIFSKTAIPIQYQPSSIVLQYNKGGIVQPWVKYGKGRYAEAS